MNDTDKLEALIAMTRVMLKLTIKKPTLGDVARCTGRCSPLIMFDSYEDKIMTENLAIEELVEKLIK